MPINNYLITGVNPSNLERQVPLDKSIRVQFAKHMNPSSLNPSTLVLRKVNGENIPYTHTYHHEMMFVSIKPAALLEAGTQYELYIPSGVDGIKSITDDYLSKPRTYEFTTGFEAAISAPKNLQVTVDSGFPTLTWETPDVQDPLKAVRYKAYISSSNQFEQPVIWPAAGDLNEVGSTTLNVPKKFTEGAYYAYVEAISGTEKSPVAMKPFNVEAAPTASPSPSPTPTPMPEDDIFSFDLVDTYPRAQSANITPEMVILVFSSPLDMETVTENSVYIVKKAAPEGRELSLVDFMTDFAPSKQVPATLALSEPNVLTLNAAIDNDAVYTVVVRASVKSLGGGSLGFAESFSFTATYSTLYGDAELVRKDMGSFSADLDDATLYRYLHDNSVYAYEMASRMSSFAEGDYSDGRAPFYMHQYVRLKTLHDLLLHTQLHKDNGGAVKNISLGDLTVAKETDAGGTSLNSLLQQVRNRLKPFMDMMQGHNNRGYAKPSMVVRGESGQTEPTFLSRSEYRELGQ